MPRNGYWTEVAYRNASKFAESVREFERLMKECMTAGYSHEEAFEYVCIVTREGM